VYGDQFHRTHRLSRSHVIGTSDKYHNDEQTEECQRWYCCQMWHDPNSMQLTCTSTVTQPHILASRDIMHGCVLLFLMFRVHDLSQTSSYSMQCANIHHRDFRLCHSELLIDKESNIAFSSHTAGDIRNAEATSITAPHTENQTES